MSETTNKESEPEAWGISSLTRRERLERIANAERDRRAGHTELAIATIGEPVEWPARAVVALARLSRSEDQTRRLLEEGLDLWARESRLGELNVSVVDEAVDDSVAASDFISDGESDAEVDAEVDPLGLASEIESMASALDEPLDSDELDQAFAEAEADVESMHDVNEVAERVLMDERVSFSDVVGDEQTPTSPSFDGVARAQDGLYDFDVLPDPDRLGMDAAYVEREVEREVAREVSGEVAPEVPIQGDFDERESRNLQALATLENWLRNLEHRTAGRAS